MQGVGPAQQTWCRAPHVETASVPASLAGGSQRTLGPELETTFVHARP